MQPVAFNPDTDLAPIPFDDDFRQLAAALKQVGLPWKPHVGCFVWDPDQIIKTVSPFPHHIYFILSLPRFIEIFGSIEIMQAKLVWLPTWHQTRLLCQQYDIETAGSHHAISATEELKALYRRLLAAVSAR
jgi:hypothetical protein